MSDRLRRLDALFAERVLGRVTGHSDIIEPGKGFRDGWWWSYPEGTGHILMEGGRNPVPLYTRSLDAAWEASSHWPIIELYLSPRGVHVEVERDGYEDMGDASHPAEALVLACLRAVGCTEEELG